VPANAGDKTNGQKNDKRSNAEKCKIFREKKKQKKANLKAEMEREEIRNSNLTIKVKHLEGKVATLKKIILKNAKKENINKSQDYIGFICDY
jgi:hypothetical protein